MKEHYSPEANIDINAIVWFTAVVSSSVTLLMYKLLPSDWFFYYIIAVFVCPPAFLVWRGDRVTKSDK